MTAPEKRDPTDTYSADASDALPVNIATPSGSRLAISAKSNVRRVPVVEHRPVLFRYVAAVFFCFIALGLTMAGGKFLDRAVFVFFWPAAIGSAIVGGMGPAILASVLSIALADYFLIPPLHQLSPLDPSELVLFAIFLLTSLLVGWLTTRLYTARQDAALAAAQNAKLATGIEEQAIELEHQLEESQALQEELEQSSEELVERTAQAEAAEEYSRGILESIADPFVVQDAEWRFRYINKAAQAIFQSSRRADAKSLIGKVMWDVYPNIIGTDFEREMRRAATERIPVTFEGFYPERSAWSLLFCYPLPDGGLATQWKDITAVKRANEASHYLARAGETLSASLDYEKTLAELAHVVVPEFADWCAVDIVGDDGRLTQIAVAHVDPEKVRYARELGRRYPPDPSAPTGAFNVIRTGKPEIYPEITEEMLVAGSVDDEHLRIIRELGLKSAMAVPLIARDKPLGVLTLISAESGRRYTQEDLTLAMHLAKRAAIAVDNARLHRAEAEARRAAEAANLAKTQFLAVMSHELRTPLNAIAGYAELMRMGIRGPITLEQQDDLDRIKRSQRNLLSLINDVLNYAKLEAGHVEFDTKPVIVHDFLADVESLVTPQLQGKGVRYEYAECDSGLTVAADVEKMRQILLNLLSNAIKFTPSGGLVSIDCGEEDLMVRICVSDTGVGIPEDKIGMIFEPFVQLDRKLTSAHEGTGLGLAISRDLARGMGGELKVESAIGEGSKFTLELPRS